MPRSSRPGAVLPPSRHHASYNSKSITGLSASRRNDDCRMYRVAVRRFTSRATMSCAPQTTTSYQKLQQVKQLFLPGKVAGKRLLSTVPSVIVSQLGDLAAISEFEYVCWRFAPSCPTDPLGAGPPPATMPHVLSTIESPAIARFATAKIKLIEKIHKKNQNSRLMKLALS